MRPQAVERFSGDDPSDTDYIKAESARHFPEARIMKLTSVVEFARFAGLDWMVSLLQACAAADPPASDEPAYKAHVIEVQKDGGVAAFSADSKLMAVSGGNEIRVYEVPGGKEHVRMQMPDKNYTQPAFAADVCRAELVAHRLPDSRGVWNWSPKLADSRIAANSGELARGKAIWRQSYAGKTLRFIRAGCDVVGEVRNRSASVPGVRRR